MLSDLKVVELASVLAGPAIGMFLSELGADVIKVEHPERGDVTRTWKLPSEDKNNPLSAYFSCVNYGKSYLKVDLKSPEGQKKVKEMIMDADIVLLNFKAGDAERFGLSFSELRQHNPGLIWVDLQGFHSTPERVAYDVVIQAETGYMHMNGDAKSGPIKLPLAFSDLLAAHQLKQGLLLALYQREKTGKGCHVNTSLERSAIANLANQASNWLMAGKIAERMGSLHPNIAPYGESFLTGDGRTIVLAIGSDKQFRLLLEILDAKELLEDERFQTNQGRVKHRTELKNLLTTVFHQNKAMELMEAFNAQKVPAGIVRNMKEVFENPIAQSMVLEEEIEGIATKRVASVAFTLED